MAHTRDKNKGLRNVCVGYCHRCKHNFFGTMEKKQLSTPPMLLPYILGREGKKVEDNH